MDDTMAVELEERIRYYETPENDPGPLTSAEWLILVLTGIVLPIVCLVLGWLVGWTS
jgi:hypothetical protein